MILKKMKLAPKMAMIIGTILTLIFVILITATAFLTKSAIDNSVAGEFSAISKSNAQQVQQIFDTAQSVAADMQSYLVSAYEQAEANPESMIVSTDPEVAKLFKSEIYGVTLSPLDYSVENYLIETARGNAANNADIVGVGAMFEPNKFSASLSDYAFYINQTNKDSKVEPFGKYADYSKEEYYKDAAELRTTIVTPPYVFEGITMVSIAIPVIHSGELKGVLMADINVDNFDKVDATNARYPSMYATIYDNQGQIIYDSEDTGNVGKSMNGFYSRQDELAQVQSHMAGSTAFEIETTREDGRKVSRYFTPIELGSNTWWSMTAMESTDKNEAVITTTLLLILIAAIALAFIIIVLIVILRRMLAPMKGVVSAAESIASGNLDVQITVASEDEIGILSQEFLKMSTTLKRIVDDMKYLLIAMGEGNFDVSSRARDSYVGDFTTILESTRKLKYKMSDALSQINQAAEQVSSGSDQVSSGAQALSQGATEQAASVQELAATINTISGKITQNAGNAAHANSQAQTVGEEAGESNRRMQDMLSAMGEISGSSAEIGKIIKTIEDIAFQTNILALNAAVEAARAGEAGKGFAVVADEVRNLSSKSTEASKNTAALIESSLRAVDNGTRIANETAQSLGAVVEGIRGVAQTVGSISEASNEQAQSIMQVTTGIDQISNVVQTNSATSEESAAASEELSSQAQMLKTLVSQFRLYEKGAASNPAPQTDRAASGAEIVW